MIFFLIYKNIYNMENKEENSTALLNASVKVEICWGGINGVIYKRKMQKEKYF